MTGPGGTGVPGASVRHVLGCLAVVEARLREHAAAARARAAAAVAVAEPGGDDPLAGYYVSEAEAAALLAAPLIGGAAPAADGLPAALDRLDAALAGPPEGAPPGARLRLAGLIADLDLGRFDVAVLLTCLAAELDQRVGRVVGYLHDDLTRRSPSVDLVLSAWSVDLPARIAARSRFAPGAPLRRHRLVHVAEPGPGAGSLPEAALRADARIVRHLLDDDDPDERLRDVVTVVEPASVADPAGPGDDDRAHLAAVIARTGGEVAVHVAGPPGSGRRALVTAAVAALGRPLLVLHGSALAAAVRTGAVPAAEGDPAPGVSGGPAGGAVAVTGAGLAHLLAVVGREATLRRACVLVEGVDVLTAREGAGAAPVLAEALDTLPGPVFLSGELSWAGAEPLRRPLVRHTLGRPDAAAARALWAAELAGAAQPVGEAVDVEALAGAFRFTHGQIRGTVTTAAALALGRDPGRPVVAAADLSAAARSRAGRTLGTLARHVVSPYGWDDLVLPGAQVRQLRHLADQVRHRALVNDAWGFGRIAPAGGGMTVLFAGPPGTGKTMAASVLANALGVDLYAVDLSTTVSKYIGETEKNLSRIFEEAAASHAVLLFDEADALFGKRTQVRDAHDRYANLETSYLLQQLEVHPGVVVLATNLRKNMDEAFVRRFRATVDFPVPDEAERRLIWERIWPTAAPRSADVDLDVLARHVELTGGHIRNIVLGGAFLAAADGGSITMDHLVRATQDEYVKLGKIVADREFGVPARNGSARPGRTV